MMPLTKPSRIFHAVWAYWLTSSAGFSAKAEGQQATTHATAIPRTTTSCRRGRLPGMARILSRDRPAHRLLELEADRELDRTWAADLIQRAEAAALSPGSQRAVQHLRGLPELRGAEVVDRTAEVRMVQDVEHVHASLEREAARHAELTAHRQVPLRRAESPQSVAPEIALNCGRGAECLRVDDPASRRAGLVEIERHARNHVRTLHAAGSRQRTAEGVFPRDHVDGRRAARVHDRIDRPILEDGL